MTNEHVEADRIAAERIDYARDRLEEWRDAEVAMARAEAAANRATADQIWRLAAPIHRRCFEAYLVVEASILAERRAVVRRLDAALYARHAG